MELLPSLLAGLRAVCATFPDPRKGRRGNIAIADFGLSAFALFFMQSASFLAFQRTLEKGHGRSNCQTLFGIEKTPSDIYTRDVLDTADPALLQPCFERIEQLLATAPLRQDFARLGDRILIAWGSPACACYPRVRHVAGVHARALRRTPAPRTKHAREHEIHLRSRHVD